MSFSFQVEFTGNNFQTLSHRSFVFQSWNEILFSENRIMFMETGALVKLLIWDNKLVCFDVQSYNLTW